MLVVRYALIGLFMPLQLSFVGFGLLVLATVCISAAGYIINDYFDVNADMMNKPDKVIIGKSINRRNAMIMHWCLNIVGCICGGLVSFGIGRPNFTFVFIFIAGILWFYSTTFSKEPVLGNVVIALNDRNMLLLLHLKNQKIHLFLNFLLHHILLPHNLH